MQSQVNFSVEQPVTHSMILTTQLEKRLSMIADEYADILSLQMLATPDQLPMIHSKFQAYLKQSHSMDNLLATYTHLLQTETQNLHPNMRRYHAILVLICDLNQAICTILHQIIQKFSFEGYTSETFRYQFELVA